MHELLQILTKEEEIPPNTESVQKLGTLHQFDLVLFAVMRLQISQTKVSVRDRKQKKSICWLNTRNELCENLFRLKDNDKDNGYVFTEKTRLVQHFSGRNNKFFLGHYEV